MNLWASSYPTVVVVDDGGGAEEGVLWSSSPLASDSESSTTVRKPSPIGCAFESALSAAAGVAVVGTMTRIDGGWRTAEVVPFFAPFFDFRAGTAEEEQPLSFSDFFVTLGDSGAGGAGGGGDCDGGGGGDGNDDGDDVAAAAD